ncbi:MAG TPA: alpha/beta fold hydrolase [Steroidobacteraceae bacterium]|nr:alpha/beta fold hydrolase [Steroidobacteraceae bacterium]
MDQAVRFVTASDGVRLAYASSGDGLPLIKTANWMNHVEFDWESPVFRHWFAALSSQHRLHRYDARGCGLSDWVADDLSLDRQVADLESVVDASGVDRFALLALSQGGAIAAEYAVRHPDRVSHLVIHGGYAQGWARRGDEACRAGRALAEIVRVGWGADTPAFRRLFTELFIPGGTPEQCAWFDELMRRTTTPEIAARIIECFAEIDVTDRLARVRAPTLVTHSRGDARIPLDQGRRLAAGIPGARFVELDSANHVLLEHEPAWQRFLDVVGDFLGWRKSTPQRRAADAPAPPRPADELDALTAREREILELVAGGANNQAIADQLFISEKTVRNHLTAIFEKIGVSSRSQAIVYARDRGVRGLRH